MEIGGQHWCFLFIISFGLNSDTLKGLSRIRGDPMNITINIGQNILRSFLKCNLCFINPKHRLIFPCTQFLLFARDWVNERKSESTDWDHSLIPTGMLQSPPLPLCFCGSQWGGKTSLCKHSPDPAHSQIMCCSSLGEKTQTTPG